MSSPILLYRNQTCALGALIVLEWLHLPYRLCRIDEYNADAPEFLKLNPTGEVPVYISDGQVLTESLAILKHLAFKGVGLGFGYRPGSIDDDHLNQTLSFFTTSLHRSFSGIFHPEVFVDRKEIHNFRQRVITEQVRPALDHVENHYLTGPFIFDHITVADAYLFGVVRWVTPFLNLEREYPKLFKFQEEMKKDRGVQFALGIESGKELRGYGGYEGHVELNSLQASEDTFIPSLRIQNFRTHSKFREQRNY